MTDFAKKYGPWCLIAGGAQGIGLAYARYIAALGVNLAIIDFSQAALDKAVPALEQEFGVQCLALALDLSSDSLLDDVLNALGEREVGLLIYNAGLADVGPFYKEDSGLDYELKKLAINVKGPLVLSYYFGKQMLARKKGGIILMSSGAGLQGSPYYSHYAATKAYDIVLAESLWGEFKPYNVDVLACIAGLTLSTAADAYKDMDRSMLQTTDELVAEAMAALGKQPSLVAGAYNRKNNELTAGLPRDQLVDILGKHPVKHFLGGKRPEQHID